MIQGCIPIDECIFYKTTKKIIRMGATCTIFNFVILIV